MAVTGTDASVDSGGEASVLDSFIRTYSDRTYSHPTMVRHQGTVLAFALAVDDTAGARRRPEIRYTVLDLAADAPGAGSDAPKPSELDVEGWMPATVPVPFPTEIAQVGFGVADQLRLPSFKIGSDEPSAAGAVPDRERDQFASTTARLTADAAFQVLSDGKHIYVFRQAVGRDDAGSVSIDRNGHVVTTADGTLGAMRYLDKEGAVRSVDPADAASLTPIVERTLLVDRFVFAGGRLINNREVRFQRSRSRTRPASEKDSLGAKDLDGRPFVEPTNELAFVDRLHEGRFTVFLAPTQVVEIERWHIMTHNSRTGMIDAYSVERAADGLFNTRGTRFYTSPELARQKDVFEPRPGTDPVTGQPLVPVPNNAGFSGAALDFASTGDHQVTIAGGVAIDDQFTIETWIKPKVGDPVQVVVGDGTVSQDRGEAKGSAISSPTLWLDRNTRVGFGYGDGVKFQSHVTKSLLSPDEWAHLALSVDGATARVYVNGRLRSRFAVTPLPTSKVTVIGPQPFVGAIDEVRLWSRARSGAEHSDDSSTRLTGKELGLAAYYRLDEGRGSVVHDHTDNRANGTATTTTWISSDAPIGEGSGVQRSSFEVETRASGTVRTVTSGLTAVLYHQQANVASGYDGDQKPLKQNARVLVAFATRAADPSDGSVPTSIKDKIVALDFAVSRDGRLTQVPNTIQLDLARPEKTGLGAADVPAADVPAAESRTINAQLDQLATVQSDVRRLVKEIAQLDLSIDELSPVEGILTNPLSLARGSELTVPPGRWDSQQEIFRQWLTAKRKEDDSRMRRNALDQLAINARIEVFEDYDYQGRKMEFGPPLPVALNVTNEELVANRFDNLISGVRFPVAGPEFPQPHLVVELFELPGAAGQSLRLEGNMPRLEPPTGNTWNDKTSSMRIMFSAPFEAARTNADQDLFDAGVIIGGLLQIVENARLEMIEQLRRWRELRTSKAGLLQTKQTEESQLVTLLRSGAQATMPLVHSDASGLTLSGAILDFAWTADTPTLFDSAMGQLALYFRGDAGQFFVAYYNTTTQRAVYSLVQQGNGADGVVCRARAADLDMDQIVIAVTPDTDPGRCTVTITGPDSEEEWRRVPRASSDFARILNGDIRPADQTPQRTNLGPGQLRLDTQTLVLGGGRRLPRNVREGSTIMLGDSRVHVASDTEAGASEIAVRVGRRSATGSLPAFLLDYDYEMDASTDRLTNDLYNGSLLVSARVDTNSGAGQRVADQRVTSGATINSQWSAAAPGTTLSFNGTTTAGRPRGPEQLPRFDVEDDITIETWTRPGVPTGRDRVPARILEHRSEVSDYSLGLNYERSALVFDGVGDHVNLGADVNPNSSSMTMEVWFRCDDVSGERMLMNKENHYEMAVRNGYFDYAVKDTSRPWAWTNSKSFPVEAGRWYHAAVVFINGGNERLYMNGRPVATTNVPGRALLPTSGTALLVAARGDHAPHDFFVGAISELQLWQTARTEEQIRASMRRTSVPTTTGLVGSWRLSSIDGLVANLVPGGKSGQVVGSPTGLELYRPYASVQGRSIESREVFPAGEWSHLAAVYRQSFGVRFDGKGGFLDAGNSGTLNIDQDLAIDVTFAIDAGSLGWQGLLARGSFVGGAGQHCPYAVSVRPDDRMEFSFEDDHGNDHSFTTTRSISRGQTHRFVVVREQKNHSTTFGDLETYIFSWSEIRLYLDSRAVGTFVYAENEAAVAAALELDPNAKDLPDDHTKKKNLRTSVGGKIEDQPVRVFKPVPVGRSSQPLVIGRSYRPASVPSIPLRGIITELRIGNQAPSSVVDLIVDGVVARWKFSERDGTRANDSVGENHANFDGTVEWIHDPDPQQSSLMLYHNGAAIETDAIPSAEIPESSVGGGGFALGARPSSSGQLTDHYLGELEETRVWRIARSRERIQDNMFRRLTGEQEHLICSFTYDVDTGTAAAAGGAPLLLDGSFRGNSLVVTQPDYILSSAPIGEDAPQIRSALAGVKTRFHGLLSGTPAVAEYGDLQQDNDGKLAGSFKRSYGIIQNGAWRLITGFKIGDILSEWVGQVQFAPQLTGFIEGAPPVPSENLTATGYVRGEFADYVGASSVERTQATETVYRYSVAKDQGADLSVNFNIGGVIGAKADVGFIYETEALDIQNVIGVKGRFDTKWSWLDEAKTGAGTAVTETANMSLRGSVENVDAVGHPAVGRRFVPDNVGMALVTSETADVFALRLEHNGALISFHMQPNPDIPRDVNIITFPINPRYTKQGVLDGKVGLEPDPNYPNALSYSSNVSYFKPIEAYGWKKEIDREAASLATYYNNFDAAGWGSAAPDTGSGINSRLRSEMTGGYKRNLANTYVWTADGGLFAEEESALDEVQEVTGGSFEFTGLGGLYADLTIGVFGIGLRIEAEALVGGHLNRTVTKSRDSETGFGLAVDLSGVESDIYLRDENGELVMDLTDSRNPVPRRHPGRVDAYRFMSFYRQPLADHFDTFFNKVVDPLWLDGGSPGALALLQARQDQARPPCWRIVHRVTFISRVLPPIEDTPPTSLDRRLRELDIDSNYELIRKLEPLVGNRRGSAAELAEAIDAAVREHLPELIPHLEAVKRYMSEYLGIGGREESDAFGGGSLAERVANQPPIVDAGLNQIVGMDDRSIMVDLEAMAVDDRLDATADLYTTWTLVTGTDGISDETSPKIADSFAPETTATFTERGRYGFTFRASDGTLSAEDQVFITVNVPPLASAGGDLSVDRADFTELLAGVDPESATAKWIQNRAGDNPAGAVRLPGRVLDDGLGDPERGSITVAWADVDDTGSVKFENPSSLTSWVTFAEAGYYRLKLTVDNGSFTVVERLAVAVATRTTEGLAALWTFEDQRGDVVRDVSGVGPPIDLEIAHPGAVQWVEGGLRLVRPTILRATRSADTFVEAATSTGGVSVEAWLEPGVADHLGLGRVLTLSSGAETRNLLLAQRGRSFHGAVRSSTTTANAADQALAAGTIETDRLTHVVLTRERDGRAALYIDGEVKASRMVGGDLSTWATDFQLALGHEIGLPGPGDSGWLGTFRLVALYSRALSEAEVRQNQVFGADRNLPPVLEAGPDQTVEEAVLPVIIDLTPQLVIDDRVGRSPAVSWSLVGGPRSIAHDDDHPSRAVFTEAGSYRLLIAVEDKDGVSSSDERSVIINSAPTIKAGVAPAPIAEGEVATIALPDRLRLAGRISDIGRYEIPAAVPTVSWTMRQGPAPVRFTRDDQLETDVEIDQSGEYEFELQVGNGLFDATDTVVVHAYAAPVISAGTDQIVEMAANGQSTSVRLNGVVTDSGIGAPRETLELRWRQLDGAGRADVAFQDSGGDGAAVTANFSDSGTYTLEFEAKNSHLRTTRFTTVVVNEPPTVDAGPSLLAAVDVPVHLDGTVADDGLPTVPGRVAMVWRAVDGSGPVTFAPASSDFARASFETPGVHRVRLDAFDGFSTGSDETTVVVTSDPAVNAGSTVLVSADTLPVTAPLDGRVDLGELDGATIERTSWLVIDGSRGSSFEDADALTTNFQVLEAGSYRCRLTAWIQVPGVVEPVIGTSEVSIIAGSRVRDGLELLYGFEGPLDAPALATGPLADGMGLVISDATAVSRPVGTARGLAINASTTVATVDAATELIRRLTETDALTLEVWVTPRAVEIPGAGPARIITLSASSTKRNLTLGQSRQGAYEVRLRTTETSDNGTGHGELTGPRVDPGRPTHVVFTWDEVSHRARLYVDGVERAVKEMAGTLSADPRARKKVAWNPDHRLALANELTGDRPWHGDFHVVAIYSRALSDEEVRQNYFAPDRPVAAAIE